MNTRNTKIVARVLALALLPAAFGEAAFTLPGDNGGNTAPAPVVATLSGPLPGDDRYAVAAGTGEQAVITIADYDAPALVGFRAGSDVVAAGETAAVRVELANGVVATRAVSVIVNFDNGRAAERIEIGAGNRFTLLRLRVSTALRLTLSSPTNAVLASGSGEARIGLRTPPPPEPRPEDPGDSGGGGGGTMMLTVTPAGPSEVKEGAAVTYTIARTDAATAARVRIGITPRSSGANANDLSTVEMMEMPAGVAVVEHVVSALLDSSNERDERFAVAFTPIDKRGTPMDPPQLSELTITNLEPFRLEADATELNEGDIVRVRVTRPEGVAMNRQFNLRIEALRVNPRGTAAEDLQIPAFVTLRPGARFAGFRLQALRDVPEEPDERFNVSVAGAGTLAFTVTDAARLPGAGGAELAWWQLTALAALGALALLAAAAFMPAAAGRALWRRRARRWR